MEYNKIDFYSKFFRNRYGKTAFSINIKLFITRPRATKKKKLFQYKLHIK